jgi:AcrR family transcriptional regulator
MPAMDATKLRLLEAAGEEFAEKGFEGAKVRSICSRAGVNNAAVNYHFGDKEQLYVQAVLEAHRCGTELLPDEVFRQIAMRVHVIDLAYAFGRSEVLRERLLASVRPELANDIRSAIRAADWASERLPPEEQTRSAQARVIEAARNELMNL